MSPVKHKEKTAEIFADIVDALFGQTAPIKSIIIKAENIKVILLVILSISYFLSN